LLVLPRLDTAPAKTAWIALLDLALDSLPGLDVSHLASDVRAPDVGAGNGQTREAFAAEAAAIVANSSHLTWLAPSRDESAAGAVLEPEVAQVWPGEADTQPEQGPWANDVQGGRERGLVLHKLLEEVLTGETAQDSAALIERARSLIMALGRPAVEDAAQGLSPAELAGCVTRTLALSEIAELRPILAPEFPVYASVLLDEVEQATAGIADAIGLGPDGKPQVVIDWKSDVQPAPEAINHYRAQVRAYLDMTGAARGLIVLVTTGEIIQVTRAPLAVVAA
jgi:exodeoxyribonuclease-5